MRWQDYITADPAVVAGKPIIRGTRISVEFLLKLLAGGWTPEQIQREYPHLPAEATQAALLFAAETVEQERLYPTSITGAA
jgi:uncharacterized protein (DUF433 family)